MVLIDSHCHLERADFADVPSVVARAREVGLVHAVVVGQLQRPGDFGDALEVAASDPTFFTPTMGIHPHDAAAATEADFAALEALCARPEVAAVGEAGLDFFYDRSPRPAQEEAFRRQCALAKRLGKPLVVHVRDAHERCHQLLAEEGISRGIIHCFTGDAAAARRYLDLGLSLSLSGILTYPKTQPLQEAARLAPIDRLLVETDSPFLTPVPHRGKKNEPANVAHTARFLAQLKGLPEDEVALQTARNAVAAFGLRVAI